MNWQEEEVQQRKKEADDSNRLYNHRINGLKQFWRILVKENEKLLPELRLKHHGGEEDGAYLYGRECLTLYPTRIASSEDYPVFNIEYDVDKQRLVAYVRGQYCQWVTENDAEVIVKNLCLGNCDSNYLADGNTKSNLKPCLSAPRGNLWTKFFGKS